MKIAVIAHAHHPIRRPFVGGLEAHTYQLIAKLEQQGHEVTLFAKHGSNTLATHSVTIFRGNAHEGKHPFYDRGYNYAIKRIALSQFDVIFNNSFNAIPILKHLKLMPSMVTIFHTPPLPKMVQALRGQPDQPNRVYIAVSEFTAKQWQPYCSAKIRVVPNGIDLDNWHANIVPPQTKRASWVGRITPEKGTHLALEACIDMGLPITIGGFVSDKQYFRKKIKSLLKHQLVTYLGHIDCQQVNDLYKNSSVALATPLWDEPFGLVAVEALASGTPVAAFSRGGLQSLITSNVGALAKYETVASLQAAIRRALTKNRRNCVRYAHQNFTLHTMVARYLNHIPVSSAPPFEELSWTPNQ